MASPSITLLGSVFNTTSGTKSVAGLTPAVDSLIVIVAAHTNSTASVNPTDNNPGGAGTYTRINTCVKASNADTMEVWVRTALISSASSTTFTQVPGTTTGGGLLVFQITSTAGIKAGTLGIRQSAVQSNQSASTTPAPALGSTPISQDGIITAVFNATNPAGVTQRSGYSLQANLGYTVPTTGLVSATKNSGETSATITWGSTSATAFCSLAIEIDTRVTHDNTGGLTGAGSAVSNMVVDALVIGGGGGGGGYNDTSGGAFVGGGGGAGEVRSLLGFAVSQGNSLTVTVGAVGTGGTTGAGGNGTASVFSSISAAGGTGGDGSQNGGASGNSFAGGTGFIGGGNNADGGGGGGSTAVGANGTGGGGGAGGAGTTSSIRGSSATYAGGGGGGSIDDGFGNGAAGGGKGGFVTSASSAAQTGFAATANTGSGGGGGAGFDAATGGGGGNGGSGIVVLSYPNTYPRASLVTGSPTFTNISGRYVYVWTGSGSITWPVFGAIHPHTTKGALTGQGSTIAGAAKHILSVYPAPAYVLAGVVYGPDGIYTGTLTLTAGESIIGLRSFTGRF